MSYAIRSKQASGTIIMWFRVIGVLNFILIHKGKVTFLCPQRDAGIGASFLLRKSRRERL